MMVLNAGVPFPNRRLYEGKCDFLVLSQILVCKGGGQIHTHVLHNMNTIDRGRKGLPRK